MARITVEKAVEKIGSRFDLVLVASQRARELKRGSASKVDKPGYAYTVTALREIEEGHYTKQDYLKSLKGKNK